MAFYKQIHNLENSCTVKNTKEKKKGIEDEEKEGKEKNHNLKLE
jgi:hypothetical protein